MTATTTPSSGRARNDALDLLRGLVMVLMALDHARDFFSNHASDPAADLATTTPALFFTRWITHFCAPVFVFLAGTSAFLAGTRRTRPELARFLFTRGLWLLVAEVTLVRWGWFFTLGFHLLVIQVIWTLGISMIILSALVFLPPRLVGTLGIALVVGHDLLDRIHATDLGSWSWLWTVLHERGMLAPPGHRLLVIYPLVPWPGVMAAGYAFGTLYTRPAEERRRVLVRLGAALTAAFLVVRATNLYGDPRPWTPGATAIQTTISFLACSKYPPSLCYLLMTLGPAIAFLGLVDGVRVRRTRPIVTFGRVPFFYYLLHVPLLHLAAVVLGAVLFGAAGASFSVGKLLAPPADWVRYGFSLPVVYLAWSLAVLALYPACRWFADLKARNRSWWLSYL
jgi:uncharacterized membrane protein